MIYKNSIQFLKAKEKKRQDLLEKRFNEAWHDFNIIVTHIIDQYKPKRIIQWSEPNGFKRPANFYSPS
jgi:hypothetical protein